MSTRMCNCVGPQNGQPRCPCMMRYVTTRDGRWIEPERDLGPVGPNVALPTMSIGCVCPPGAELTCRGILCPRRALSASTDALSQDQDGAGEKS